MNQWTAKLMNDFMAILTDLRTACDHAHQRAIESLRVLQSNLTNWREPIVGHEVDRDGYAVTATWTSEAHNLILDFYADKTEYWLGYPKSTQPQIIKSIEEFRQIWEDFNKA